MSILSGFPGNVKISDCPGWFRMLSLSLSHGRPLETQQLKELRCRVSRQERNTSLHWGTSNRREARKIADTYEAAARTKRTLLQTRKVIERLHEEMTGETISRVTTRSRVIDWLATKKPEIAFTSLAFYENSLRKFLDFLGPKADAPISEVTKADIVAVPKSALNPGIRKDR
jgi:hypothetical protein